MCKFVSTILHKGYTVRGNSKHLYNSVLIAETQSWTEFWNSIISSKKLKLQKYFFHAFAIKEFLKQWNLGLKWCHNCCNCFIIFNLFSSHTTIIDFPSTNFFCTKLWKRLTVENKTHFNDYLQCWIIIFFWYCTWW